MFGSNNGLLPVRRQAIIWTNAGLLLVGPLGKKTQWNLNQNKIFIQENAFENVGCKMATTLSRPQYVETWESQHERLTTILGMGFTTHLCPKSVCNYVPDSQGQIFVGASFIHYCLRQEIRLLGNREPFLVLFLYTRNATRVPVIHVAILICHLDKEMTRNHPHQRKIPQKTVVLLFACE